MIFFGLLGVSSVASAATYTSEATVITSGQLCGAGTLPVCLTNELFSHSQFETEHTGDLSVSHYASSGTTPSGNVTVSGEADMASGKIRVVTSATALAAGTGSQQNARASVSAAATLGDTFKLYNNDGTPFTSAGTSKLSVGIDGILEGTTDSGISLNIAIGVYRPGYFDALAVGEDPSALSIGYASTGFLSATDVLPEELSLDFIVAPDSSFEWYVSVFSMMDFEQADDEHIFGNVDLGHTISINFESPENTYFASASGLFPGSVAMAPVPLPPSFVMLGLGLASLVGVSRRRS